MTPTEKTQGADAPMPSRTGSTSGAKPTSNSVLDAPSEPLPPLVDHHGRPLTGRRLKELKARRRVWLWERYFIWPMFILSIIYSTLVIILMFQPALMTPVVRKHSIVAVTVMWVLFCTDYLVRLYVAPNRWRFFKSGWADLFSLLVPFFRPLMPLWYAYRLPLKLGNTVKAWRIRYQMTVATITVFFTYTISILVWWAEQGQPMASISNWGDSLWWSIASITTVGYGDVVPVSTVGRVLGSLLMFGGIFLVGTISASTVSALTEKFQSLTAAHTKAVHASWWDVYEDAPTFERHHLFGHDHSTEAAAGETTHSPDPTPTGQMPLALKEVTATSDATAHPAVALAEEAQGRADYNAKHRGPASPQ